RPSQSQFRLTSPLGPLAQRLRQYNDCHALTCNEPLSRGHPMPALLRRALLLLVCASLIFSAAADLPAGDDVKKVPVPGKKELAKSAALIQDIFGDDIAKAKTGEAVDADNYESALQLADLAEKAASKAQQVALVRAVQQRKQDVLTVQKGFARLQPYVDRLKKDPKDAEANLELGKYFGLLKGKW